MELTLVLPLPPSGLSPNARLHWSRKSPLTARVRGEARLVALAARNGAGIREPMLALTLTPTFYFGDNRRRDKSNCSAMLKGIEDGIADALSGGEDSGYSWGPVVIKKNQDDPRLEIKVALTQDTES